MHKLKVLNELQFLLQLIEDKYLLIGSQQTDFSEYIELIKKYNLKNIQISAADIKQFIHDMENAIAEQNLIYSDKNNSITPFSLNIHEVLIDLITASQGAKKTSLIIADFIKARFNLSDAEFKNIAEYCHTIDSRVNEVFSYAIHKSCNIMIDAEQSYLQYYIDYQAAYLFKMYNKEDSIISTTLQSYLKSHMCRLIKYRSFCDINNVKLGLKIVRGAYMSEERRLAGLNNYPSPICDDIDSTHKNYNDSLNYVFGNLKDKEKVGILFLNII